MHFALLMVLDQLFAGNTAFLEHPARTHLHDVSHPVHGKAASVWSTPQVAAIRQHPAIALVYIEQGSLGGVAKKPTSFLTANVDSLEAHARQLSLPRHWQQPLVGRDESGKFKTFSAKEYPPLLNLALACATVDHICRITGLRTSAGSLPSAGGASRFASRQHDADFLCRCKELFIAWDPYCTEEQGIGADFVFPT